MRCPILLMTTMMMLVMMMCSYYYNLCLWRGGIYLSQHYVTSFFVQVVGSYSTDHQLIILITVDHHQTNHLWIPLYVVVFVMSAVARKKVYDLADSRRVQQVSPAEMLSLLQEINSG